MAELSDWLTGRLFSIRNASKNALSSSGMNERMSGGREEVGRLEKRGRDGVYIVTVGGCGSWVDVCDVLCVYYTYLCV